MKKNILTVTQIFINIKSVFFPKWMNKPPNEINVLHSK